MEKIRGLLNSAGKIGSIYEEKKSKTSFSFLDTLKKLIEFTGVTLFG